MTPFLCLVNSFRISAPNTILIPTYTATTPCQLIHLLVGILSPTTLPKIGITAPEDKRLPFEPKSTPSASSAMTTNLNAIAGPSKLPPSPLVEIESPAQSLDSPGREAHRGLTQEPTVSRPGLSVDENGEIIKVPAFLNKLFR
jgi:hypothetical protein